MARTTGNNVITYKLSVITAPSSHPLLMSRHNVEVSTMSVSRTQRANRQRRYQYLQLNPRNHNPPVILQRYVDASSILFILSLSHRRVLGNENQQNIATCHS